MKHKAMVTVVGGTKDFLGNSKDWIGFFKAPPTIGKSFYLMAEDMYDDDNYLTTDEVSAVQEIPGGYKFKTVQGTVFEVVAKPMSQKSGRA